MSDATLAFVVFLAVMAIVGWYWALVEHLRAKAALTLVDLSAKSLRAYADQIDLVIRDIEKSTTYPSPPIKGFRQ